MHTIKCRSISDAYLKGIDYIIRTGIPRGIHGTTVLQADEVCLDININNDDDVSPHTPLKSNASVAYVAGFLNPDKGEQPYTYGERITNYRGINQLDSCIYKLQADKYTRQAVCSLWNPLTDSYMDDPPCLQHIQFYYNNADEFTIKLLFRSHDFYQAMINNLQALKFVAKYVAGRLNDTPKRMILDSSRPHIYWYNVETCKRLVDR